MSVKDLLVSVIVSTYNSERFIRGKIEDLLNQSIFDKIEIIIINSGSLENEEIIIKEYLNKYKNIKYLKSESRQTIYEAWNFAIKNSKGTFITNSNTDDRLREDALEVMANYLIQNPEVALVYSDQIISNIENERFIDLKRIEVLKFPDFKINYMLERCIIGSQPMWRSSLHFQDNIWFDEKFEVCGDHDFELRVALKYKIHHLNIPLGLYYKSPDKKNKEYENLDRNLREVRKIQETYIPIFLNSLNANELNELKKFYRKYLFFPLPVLFMIKFLMKLLNTTYPKFFFHSIGFIYFMNILLYKKMNNSLKAIKLSKRYLKYKKSDLVLLGLKLEVGS